MATPESTVSNGPSVASNVYYFTQRSLRNSYFDERIHLLMLTLLVTLLMTPKRQLLDMRYCDRNTVLNKKKDVPGILALHLNHQMNVAVQKKLPQALGKLGIAGFRFLKLLCPRLSKK